MKSWILIAGIALVLLVPLSSAADELNTAAAQIIAIPNESEIVLGDMTFRIADHAQFYAQDERTSISYAQFKEGDWVEISINSDGEIDEMWLSSEYK